MFGDCMKVRRATLKDDVIGNGQVGILASVTEDTELTLCRKPEGRRVK